MFAKSTGTDAGGGGVKLENTHNKGQNQLYWLHLENTTKNKKEEGSPGQSLLHPIGGKIIGVKILIMSNSKREKYVKVRQKIVGGEDAHKDTNSNGK